MRAGFLPGASGSLFVIRHDAPTDPIGNILYLPPFAEEMNKCRRMAHLQARRFANAGFDVLMPDLHGTGDSGGDFADARWESWLSDSEQLAKGAFRACGAPLTLWATRLGALLAMDLLSRGSIPVRQLMLWQPAVNGELFMQQFLRLKVAAQMLGASGEKQSTALFRDRLLGGEAVEIAGYMVAPELYRSVVAQRAVLPAEQLDRAAMFEVTPVERDLSPVNRALTAQLAAAGAKVTAKCVAGPAFWSTVEVELAPSLFEASDSFVAEFR